MGSYTDPVQQQYTKHTPLYGSSSYGTPLPSHLATLLSNSRSPSECCGWRAIQYRQYNRTHPTPHLVLHVTRLHGTHALHVRPAAHLVGVADDGHLLGQLLLQTQQAGRDWNAMWEGEGEGWSWRVWAGP